MKDLWKRRSTGSHVGQRPRVGHEATKLPVRHGRRAAAERRKHVLVICCRRTYGHLLCRLHRCPQGDQCRPCCSGCRWSFGIARLHDVSSTHGFRGGLCSIPKHSVPGPPMDRVVLLLPSASLGLDDPLATRLQRHAHCMARACLLRTRHLLGSRRGARDHAALCARQVVHHPMADACRLAGAECCPVQGPRNRCSRRDALAAIGPVPSTLGRLCIDAAAAHYLGTHARTADAKRCRPLCDAPAAKSLPPLGSPKPAAHAPKLYHIRDGCMRRGDLECYDEVRNQVASGLHAPERGHSTEPALAGMFGHACRTPCLGAAHHVLGRLHDWLPCPCPLILQPDLAGGSCSQIPPAGVIAMGKYGNRACILLRWLDHLDAAHLSGGTP